jgi:hypothetical protein
MTQGGFHARIDYDEDTDLFRGKPIAELVPRCEVRCRINSPVAWRPCGRCGMSPAHDALHRYLRAAGL